MRSIAVSIAGCLLVLASCSDAPSADVSTPTGAASPQAEATSPAQRGDDPAAASEWTSVAPSPLSPRAAALGVWTGDGVLVVGGEPKAWCPPGADCILPDFAPLRDAAIFDPATGAWRQIADAPLSFSDNASAVTVDDSVYILVRDASYRPGGEAGFLRYLIAEDRWEPLENPLPNDGWFRITAVAGSVVVYPDSHEIDEEHPDLILDTATGTWSELPPDPLSPSYDRNMVVVEDQLYLFATDLPTGVESAGPVLARIARLDLSTLEWSELGGAEVLWTVDPITIGSEIVFPWPGEADGGEVNGWGRSYAHGGIYDTETATWFALPDPARDWSFAIAGAMGTEDAGFTSVQGAVLDVEENSWISLPGVPEDRGEVVNQTLVAVGTSLFLFGGETWTDAGGEVLDSAFIWAPS